MSWKAAGVATLVFAASSACSGEASRPAATPPPATAAPGIVATAAAPPATSTALPSAAAPAAAAAAPVGAAAAPAGGGTVLAREETKWPGIVAEVTEFRRKGNTLTAKVRFRNQGAKDERVDFYYSQSYLMDPAAGKKYEVLKDQNNTYIAALRSGYPDRWYDDIPAAGVLSVWMKFPAPPAEVKAITFQIPGIPPFDDLAIQDY